MSPEKIIIQPTYKKESGLWVLELNWQQDNFPERSIVYFPPNVIGGNHQHPRTECFACLSGSLKLYWTQDGNTASLEMNSDHQEQLTAYLIPPSLVHAVKNETESPAMLIEFASEPQHDVKSQIII